jgi:hypothetical protein
MCEVLPRLSATLADRYRIERELGAGGMATVYLADEESCQVVIRHEERFAKTAVGWVLSDVSRTTGLSFGATWRPTSGACFSLGGSDELTYDS